MPRSCSASAPPPDSLQRVGVGDVLRPRGSALVHDEILERDEGDLHRALARPRRKPPEARSQRARAPRAPGSRHPRPRGRDPSSRADARERPRHVRRRRGTQRPRRRTPPRGPRSRTEPSSWSISTSLLQSNEAESSATSSSLSAGPRASHHSSSMRCISAKPWATPPVQSARERRFEETTRRSYHAADRRATHRRGVGEPRRSGGVRPLLGPATSTFIRARVVLLPCVTPDPGGPRAASARRPERRHA
jgi:hypothetical protein